MQSVDETTGAAIAATSVMGSFAAAQDISNAIFGVPLFVIMAGFAGVVYGLTYRDAMKPKRLWGEIIFCTIIATAATPLIASWYTVPAVGMAGISAIVGFVLQWGQPILSKNQQRIVDMALEKLFGKRPTDGDKK